MIAIPHSRQVGSTRYAQRHLLSLNAKGIIASPSRVCQAVFLPTGKGSAEAGLRFGMIIHSSVSAPRRCESAASPHHAPQKRGSAFS